MNKLVLFDMDGLLVDSEPLQLKAYTEVFARYGIEITHEEYILEWIHNGKSATHYVEKYEMTEAQHRDALVQTIRDEKKQAYDLLIDNELVLKEGVLELLQKLDGKIDMIIASSSRIESIEKIVKKFGIGKYFRKLFSDAGSARSKPYPDIFLKAAKEMRVKPSECVVIEDAEKGLRAAKAAQMKCIICPDKLTENGDFTTADLVVNSISKVSYETIRDI